MTPYKRGDVVLVPFPFSNLSTTKKRPAVVISSTSYNESSLDIVILAITSKIEKSAGIGRMSRFRNGKMPACLKKLYTVPQMDTITVTVQDFT